MNTQADPTLMLTDEALAGSAQEPLAEGLPGNGIPGNPELVEGKILAFVNSDEELAMQNWLEIWNHCDTTEAIYRITRNASPSPPGGDDDPETISRLPEMADQVDSVVAIFNANSKTNGQLHYITAIAGNEQRYADFLKNAIDADLEARGAELERRAWWMRYAKFKGSIYKVTREIEEIADYEPLEFHPADYPPTPEGAEVFNQDITDAISNPNMRPTGYDMTTGAVSFINQAPKQSKAYTYRSVDPRCICFSDRKRAYRDQPCSHEFFYWNKYELRKQADRFKNLDLEKIGPPLNGDKTSPTPATATTPQSGTNQEFGTYEISQKWPFLPFMEWLEDGSFTQADLDAFEQKFELSPGATRVLQRFPMVTLDKKVIIEFLENWMPNKMDHQYFGESYHRAEGETVGDAFQDRIADICASKERSYNDLAYNTNIRGNNSMIYNKNTALTPEEMKQLRKRRASVGVKLNGVAVKDAYSIFDVPDQSTPLIEKMQFDDGHIEKYGVPAVLQGRAASRTAVQDTINKDAATGKILDPFERGVLCYKQVIDTLKTLHLMYNDAARWVRLIGEDGIEMARRVSVGREAIARRFRTDTCANFQFVERAMKVQQAAAVMSTFKGTLPPQVAMKLLVKTLELMDWDRADIDDIQGAGGARTNPQDEVEVMLYDVNVNLARKIRPMQDDHIQALAVAAAAEKQYPKLLTQRNFQDWKQAHQIYADQMAAMQQEPETPGEEKRDPQTGEPPEDEEGQARSMAQKASGPDNGVMTAGGLTGRAGQGSSV